MSHQHHEPGQHELERIAARLQRLEAELDRFRLASESTLHRILKILESHQPILATSITFQENTMNPTQAGQTQVFTGTLSPAGSVLASDAVASISSNDPAVSPSLDSTNLVASVTYPDGWVESTTTPLAFTYSTTSASTGQALSATITPSAPPSNLATGIAFAQTQ